MKSNWQKFFDSVPDDREQTIVITDAGKKVDAGKKHCLAVFGVDANSGAEYNGEGKREGQGFLVPYDAEVKFDPKTLELSGGGMSTTGNSFTPNGYDWEIEDVSAVRTPVKQIMESFKE